MRATSWLVGTPFESATLIPDGLEVMSFYTPDNEVYFQAYHISDENANRDHALRRIRKLIEEKPQFRNWC